MECVGALLTLLVLLAIAFVANTHAQEERRRVEHALRSVAQQRGGMFRHGTWFRPPAACFRHRGQLARVEAARAKSGWRFETLIELPTPVPNCHIDALSPLATF